MAVSEDICFEFRFLNVPNKSLNDLVQSLGGLSPKIPPTIKTLY
jgi:hypothetical protein